LISFPVNSFAVEELMPREKQYTAIDVHAATVFRG